MSDAPDSEAAPLQSDAIERWLRVMSFRSEVFFNGQLCDRWSLDTSGSSHVNFHAVCRGDGWLRLPGWEQPQQLAEGDVVVFPRDARHQLASHADAVEAYGRTTIARQVAPDAQIPGTVLVCGYLRVDPTAFRLVYAMLPPCFIVRADAADGRRLRALVDLMLAEAQAPTVGTSAVLDRLADALMFQAIRHAATHYPCTTGMVGALRDRQIRSALLAMLDAPEKDWSVETLADVACLSRSTFNDRFRAILDLSPMEFRGGWRMQLAHRWLGDERSSVADVAQRCGYRSEVAFAKAFKREFGFGPGVCRRLSSG